MKKLMNLLMLSCKKASELIEKKMHFPLNSIQKVQLIVHTSMCDACRSYQDQSKELDSFLENHINKTQNISDTQYDELTDDIKKRILLEIEKKK